MPVQSAPCLYSMADHRKKRRGRWPKLLVILSLIAVLYTSRGACASSPSVTFSPTSLTFANQALLTSSPAKSLSLMNTGGAALSITKIEITGNYPNEFSQTNNCGTSLAAGATCTINVIFSPIITGISTAAVTVLDNASGSLQSAALSGTGYASALVSLSASSLAFGSQKTGTTSSAQSFTLENTGTATLSISAISLTGANPSCFIQKNDCGTSLGEGGSCTINVEFDPTSAGSFTAGVTLTDNAVGNPQTVSLSGTGTSGSGSTSESASPLASLSLTSLSFGDQGIDVASSSQVVTLSNTGGAALSVSSIALTGTDPDDFTESNTCSSSVAAGGSCTIICMFTPSASGSLSASLSVSDNASGSPQTVALSGTGVHDVILAWSASSGADGYDVYRGTTSGGESSAHINSALVTGTTYVDTDVDAGQTYYYKVTAVSSSGTQSAESKEVSATVP